ncbi:MAG TPA: hypothetical protein VMM85_00740 [Methylomirabilota bacterium]|nr:hypothetical protein [Methylomirabilota bacterium]
MTATASSLDLGALLGARFVDALVRGDFDDMRSMLHPAVKFRGLSPHKFLKVSPSDSVGGVIRAFRLWLYEGEGEYADHPEELLACSVAPFGSGGRYKLSYRIRSKSREMAEFYRGEGFGEVADDADWIVEQEAYYDVLDGTIAWMIVLCGGYQPLEPVAIALDVPETASRQIVV